MNTQHAIQCGETTILDQDKRTKEQKLKKKSPAYISLTCASTRIRTGATGLLDSDDEADGRLSSVIFTPLTLKMIRPSDQNVTKN